MVNDFFITDASEQDKDGLKEIIQQSFQRFFRHFATHSLKTAGHIIVSRKNQDQTPVGYAKLTWFKIGSKQFGCILWLAVHPDFRRKGVAASLVAHSTEYLKTHGAQAVFASVKHSNIASLSTFKKEGFICVDFWGLWRFFGWRIFSFYWKIWFILGEFVLMHS